MSSSVNGREESSEKRRDDGDPSGNSCRYGASSCSGRISHGSVGRLTVGGSR
jgi:hypothetical protein